MKYSMYLKSNGKIIGTYDGPPSQVHLDMADDREIYLNCPENATHVIDCEPLDLTTIDEFHANEFNRLSQLLQRFLDTNAQHLGYDSLLSLCSYATSKNTKFAKEGQAGVDWRDACWEVFYNFQNSYNKEIIPTEEMLLAKMPALSVV